MAYTTKSSFVSFALVLVVLATSSLEANALLFNGVPVTALAVIGTARCSPTLTGACTTCPPLANLIIRVILNRNIIASASTNSDGTFKILISPSNIITNLNDIYNIRVFIELPILGCPTWASVSTGHLEGTIAAQAASIVGSVLNLPVSPCQIIH